MTELKVTLDGRFGYFAASVKIADQFEEAFKPMHASTEAILAFIAGGVTAESMTAKKIVRFREEAAKELSEALTNALLIAMRSHDTLNGYEVEK